MKKIGRPPTPLAERFWEKVAKAGPDECWPWTGERNHSGYGLLRKGSTRVRLRAHRVAYAIAHGLDPTNFDVEVVRHKCDNPSCVNPAHLAAGSHADNARDKVERGRSTAGLRNRNQRLEIADVLAIREDPRLQCEIATDYGVSQKHVSRIKRRDAWRHIK